MVSGSTAGESLLPPAWAPVMRYGSAGRSFGSHKRRALEREAKKNKRIAAMVRAGLEAREAFFAEWSPQLEKAAALIVDSMKRGGKLLIFGNGGSAADAQHIAAELAFKMGRDRAALPALALT